LVRENALCAAMAGAGSAAVAWLGLYGYAWNDYDNEARGAYDALVHGHLVEFLRLSPAYGGSLLERAPFALLPGLWGGGELAVYRVVALPCLLVGAALGVWLVARMRAERRSLLARGVALCVCVANPLTLRALELGHPEELLGGCLCVGGVLFAARGRWLWAAVLLGLGVANKEWALLAAGPVLLALPPGRRVRCALVAGGVAAVVFAPLLLVSGGFAAGTRAVASSTSAIFQPWQVWWWFGHHGALVHGLFGAPKPGYRTGPAWTGAISRPSVLLFGMGGMAILWWVRRRANTSTIVLSGSDALLALAVALLGRCLLDTWDTAYYPLPFVLALLAWEVQARGGRPPVLALSSTVLAWISFEWASAHIAPDAQAALFLAWTLPLGALLARELWASARGLVDEGEILGQAREPLVAVLADHG
jgi:hypothetical protein